MLLRMPESKRFRFLLHLLGTVLTISFNSFVMLLLLVLKEEVVVPVVQLGRVGCRGRGGRCNGGRIGGGADQLRARIP